MTRPDSTRTYEDIFMLRAAAKRQQHKLETWDVLVEALEKIAVGKGRYGVQSQASAYKNIARFALSRAKGEPS